MAKPISRRTFLQASGGATAVLGGAAALRAQAKRPNILFVIADDWGHGHAGAYGCNWIKTPNFDRVAREGILFNNTFTSNPKCSPCRATILTGRNTWQLKEAVDHFSIFPNEFAVYPDLLEKAGYFVGYTGKGWGPGDFRSTGFEHNPAGREFQKYTLTPPTSGISPQDYSRNFEYFLQQKPQDKSFCFWLGGHEPHRAYEPGSGLRAGKKLADVVLPKYYPDNRIIRSDMLDYAVEVEWFDRHLGLALQKLEQSGELDNTLIVVTSDHGMPFPRVKGQIYEHGFHIPLAIRWGKNIKPGRVIDDFINTRDFAPTFLEAAGLEPGGTMTGKSFMNILKSDKAGIVDVSRSVMLVGKERHDLGRPNDWGYPVRAIRTADFLYIRNYEPDRWPAGDPETGYRNVDDGPTKEFLLSGFDEYYKMSFGKRPAEALYLVRTDPDCIHNVATDLKYAQTKRQLLEKMEEMLRSEGDPRILGRADFFETIRYTGPRKHSYENWLKNNRQ
ncbi:MAG TPA: sulfatase-like hydrolase/transferase [Bryobacteraceae bacterium]|jgi:arylsulfatase A-like enzyme|nr:sulfatase-like hydrolase/transferase [Bryobacteraceae bacterium]